MTITRIYFASTPQLASEWGRCPECVAWYTANRAEASYASSSVGIERGLTANHALDAYMKSRHAKHALCSV